eukprot:scaffold38972_cov17-Tisochrysis_lutea.AAC.1
MGHGMKESKRALRFSGGNIQTALDFIHTQQAQMKVALDLIYSQQMQTKVCKGCCNKKMRGARGTGFHLLIAKEHWTSFTASQCRTRFSRGSATRV